MGAIDTLEYVFSAATTEPPTGNQVRFDATDPTLASKLWVRYTTNNGIDAYFALVNFAIGTRLFLQDKNNHLQHVAVETTGAAIDKIDYAEFPIAPIGQSGAALSNTQAILVVVLDPEEDTPIAPTTTTPLIALDVLKDELNITHTFEDAKLDRDRTEATRLVLELIKAVDSGPLVADPPRVPPAWINGPPEVVPESVRSMIQRVAVNIYRHRGDASGSWDPFEGIDRQVKLWRLPTLA